MKDFFYQLTSYNNNCKDLLVSCLMNDNSKSTFKWLKHVVEGTLYIFIEILIQNVFQIDFN